jgi:hypothetical protein
MPIPVSLYKQETREMTKEIAKQETETAPALTGKYSHEQIAGSGLHSGAELPVLATTKPSRIPVSAEYWSPELEGESKRGWIAGIEDREIADMETGELRMLPCVLFVEQMESGKLQRIIQASAVLVGNVRDAIKAGEIVPGTHLTPVQITYTGTKKNRSNAKLSKRWEILTLQLG